MTQINTPESRFCLVHPHRAMTWTGRDWKCPDCALREAFANNSPIPEELAGSKVDIVDAMGHKIGEGRLTADGMIDGLIDYSTGEGTPYNQQLKSIAMKPEPVMLPIIGPAWEQDDTPEEHKVVIGYNFEAATDPIFSNMRSGEELRKKIMADNQSVIPEEEWKLGSPENYQTKAKRIVQNHIDSLYVHQTVPVYEIYVVWFCKTLQNWKALVSTTMSDGMYYEVTYNGDKRETYLDVYSKIENIVIPD